ncbi:K+/H+ antiporter [Alkalilimnicola ehrlichii]|uniref:K+/H+ antiporter n=1 Tax=Alkalilimnicola ehrlichii TaxID=351052 RepID=A0A3E0X1M9_9GAMM|nr:potassium/proton antiporter [Alkalilimnicola ehrlichii]RFA31146.1 K+/H+ antiporter [Alkalilimnicola ehrlichii]RFA39569.1 K+/H+ antiporter [Alkalilimnicola ehrlichii]
MELTNQFIFGVGLLLTVSILASVVSSRIGAPLLLVFLVIGMLVGEQGPVGIHFDDIQGAHLIGSLALAIILFDGGLRTQTSSFRVGLKPALSLATVGVVITASVTGLFVSWLFNIHWMAGLLIGAIVGSTDAAAVFNLLHSRGLELKQRVQATLEIESGSNDPMAIFLTIALIDFLLGQYTSFGWGMAIEFASQMGIGALIGIIGGRGLTALINRLPLTPSLYSLLALSGGLLIYGIAAVIGGSGFLAAYLAGIILANRPHQAAQNIRRFHDGIAWLSQIGMFLMLGLLVTPSELLPVAGQAMLVAGVLILVARPLAVVICLLPFRFPWREQVFISWVGLRGAVPILLGLFPILAGVEGARDYFNIAFFIVLVSLIAQGWTIAPLARFLRIEVPHVTGASQRMELDIPGQHDHEFVGYQLQPRSEVVNWPANRVPLPKQARLLTLIRNGEPLDKPHHQTLQVGDYVYLLTTSRELPALDRLFGASAEQERLEEHRFFGEFVISADTPLGDLADAYGLKLPYKGAASELIGPHLYSRFKHQPVVGDRIRFEGFQLVVRELEAGKITKVGLKIARSPNKRAVKKRSNKN